MALIKLPFGLRLGFSGNAYDFTKDLSNVIYARPGTNSSSVAPSHPGLNFPKIEVVQPCCSALLPECFRSTKHECNPYTVSLLAG